MLGLELEIAGDNALPPRTRAAPPPGRSFARPGLSKPQRILSDLRELWTDDLSHKFWVARPYLHYVKWSCR